MSLDRERARSYFDKLAPEYDRAFRRQGRDPLNALVNRAFRGPTFARRMRLLESLLAEIGLTGRTVLDLGCGSGQVSLLAASMGATVRGIDIAPRMLEIARSAAREAGLAERARFEEGDVGATPLPRADVALLVGVIEYHRDFADLIRRAAEAAGDTLVVAHTNRVAYRMLLRRLLFALRGSSLYFHPMPDVIAAAEAAGLRLERQIREHAFTLLVFQRALQGTRLGERPPTRAAVPRAEHHERPPRQVVLSVDLDEWYHCRWATGSPRSRWKDTDAVFREHYGSDRPAGELREPTRRILDLFDRHGVRGTFFVLGEVAGFYPELVREIAARGHEIGCHGFHHVDIDLLGPEGFRRELKEAKSALERLVPGPIQGYRAPNLLLRDWMIPMLREAGFRYDASVCSSRGLLGKKFGHEHLAMNPYRFRERFAHPDPGGDLVEIPLPVFPGLRLPAATGILTRIAGRGWTLTALRHALRSGDAQYYFHPYELGPRPRITLSLRERLFLRRLGPWMEEAVDAIAGRLRSWGARFVTASELAKTTG